MSMITIEFIDSTVALVVVFLLATACLVFLEGNDEKD